LIVVFALDGGDVIGIIEDGLVESLFYLRVFLILHPEGGAEAQAEENQNDGNEF
jgi:hypothetical protein